MKSRIHTLKARCVFPIAGPPLCDGAVTIEAGRIVGVGTKPTEGDVEDLGNVALLPALVNAHAHLDLSDLAAPLGTPGMPLVDWIRCVINHRLVTPMSDSAVARGLEQSARLGVAAIGDIGQAAPPSQAVERSGIDLTSFLELIAPTFERISLQLDRAQRHIEQAAASGPCAPA